MTNKEILSAIHIPANSEDYCYTEAEVIEAMNRVRLDESIPTQSGEKKNKVLKSESIPEFDEGLKSLTQEQKDRVDRALGESMEDVLGKEAKNYLDNHPDSEVRRMYGYHYRSFKAGFEVMSIQCKERDAEIEKLKAWKESASDILNTIGLQECSKYLKLEPGSDIAKYILPALQSLSTKEAAIKDLVEGLEDI